jgi:hypothetical protein
LGRPNLYAERLLLLLLLLRQTLFSLSLLAFPIFSSFPFQPPAALSSPLFLITKLITLSRSSSQRKNGGKMKIKMREKNDDDDVRHFQMTPSANLLQVLSIPFFFIFKKKELTVILVRLLCST